MIYYTPSYLLITLSLREGYSPLRSFIYVCMVQELIQEGRGITLSRKKEIEDPNKFTLITIVL